VKPPTPSANHPKEAKTPRRAPSDPPSAASVPRRLRYALLSLACVAVSGLATYGGFTIFSPVRVPAMMRGKWLVVEGKGLRGATLEFFADGRMIGVVPAVGGEDVALKGRVEVEGNRFRVLMAGPGTSFATEPEDILELTDRRFVVQDSQGEVLILERPPPTGTATPGGAR
jgi:hypothetical protein